MNCGVSTSRYTHKYDCAQGVVDVAGGRVPAGRTHHVALRHILHALPPEDTAHVQGRHYYYYCSCTSSY